MSRQNFSNTPLNQELFARYSQRRLAGRTLQEIGDEFGVSREYVRQVIGNTGDMASEILTKCIRAKANVNKTNDQLANEFGVGLGLVSMRRGDIRHAIKRGNTSVAVGRMVEDQFRMRCIQKGLDCQLMSYRYPFDALVNNRARVDIKGVTKPLEAPSIKASNLISPLWSFQIGGKGKWENVDYFACLIISLQKWFIIPASPLRAGGRRSHIRFVYPHSGRGNMSFQRYLDRWDYLG